MDNASNPLHNRLRVATRIHFALLRHLGEGIDVGRMLRSESEAREVVWVCQASGDRELISLAQQFERATTLEAAAQASAAARYAVQDTPWSRDTSGFGLSQPPEVVEPRHAKPSAPTPAWYKPANWLRSAR